MASKSDQGGASGTKLSKGGNVRLEPPPAEGGSGRGRSGAVAREGQMPTGAGGGGMHVSAAGYNPDSALRQPMSPNYESGTGGTVRRGRKLDKTTVC